MAGNPGPPIRILALGDSLTAGYGLLRGEDFASRLQQALTAKGYQVNVDQGGVSGNTSGDGLERLDRLMGVTPKPDLVIVELGANDLIRGVAPDIMENNLRQILRRLQLSNTPAILTGMVAPFFMPPQYRVPFNRVFPGLAKEFDIPLYPFFLQGVAMNAAFNLPDGAHPNKAGIDVIVANILPTVTDALDEISAKSP